MIEINLAPGADRAQTARGRGLRLRLPAIPALGGNARVLGAAAGAAALLLLAGLGLWRQGARVDSLRVEVERAAADSTRFAGSIELLRSLEARGDTIRQRIGIIREVDERRYVWPHLLDEISRSVPSFTWLTQISSIAAPAEADPAAAEAEADSAAAPPVRHGPLLTVQGNAGSTQALTRLMKNLEASAFIRDVTLVTSEQVDVNGRTLHRFTLEARYEVPDLVAIETVPILTLE